MEKEKGAYCICEWNVLNLITKEMLQNTKAVLRGSGSGFGPENFHEGPEVRNLNFPIQICPMKKVLLIRVSFNADPDPASITMRIQIWIRIPREANQCVTESVIFS